MFMEHSDAGLHTQARSQLEDLSFPFFFNK